MSSLGGLRRRVDDRDRLVALAAAVEHDMHDAALAALDRGDLPSTREALLQTQRTAQRLAENLRIYQAELRAQADELAASQLRTQDLLTRFAVLFANLPVATLLVGRNGEVLDDNARAQSLFGFARAPVSPRFLHRLVDAAHYQRDVRPAMLEAAASGAASLQDLPFVSEQGRRFIGELHLALLPAQAGEGPNFACTVIDRTEHHEHLHALRAAGEALRTSEAFLAETAAVARAGGWELPGDGTPMRWSATLRALFGLSDDTPSSEEALYALCAPGQAPRLAAALDAARSGQGPFELELDMRARDGRPLRVLAAGHAEPGPGRDARVYGVLQDITRQHAARSRIDELSERLSLATDAGGIGIWDWDLAAGTVYLDERWHALVGEPPGPVTDLRSALAAGLADGAAAQLDAAVARALGGGGSLSVELPMRTASTDRRWIHVNGRVHLDAAGRPERVVGCAWDCSREREAARLRADKEAAESASRAKSELLSRVSHELRTPLNAILGFSELMRMEARDGDMVVKPHRVNHIVNAARHLLALINDVLDVSRAESGHIELQLEPLELAGAMAACVPMVQVVADGAGVTLVDRCARGAPARVRADKLRLHQVLLNLLSNAIKYNRSGGQVELWTDQPAPGRVAVHVADTGCGMTPAQLAGLFQPFNRVGAEHTTVEGTGMGLFVSLRLAEAMGGSIRASSTPGVGTTFTLELPADG